MKVFTYILDTLLEELTRDEKNTCPDVCFFASIICDFETIHIFGIHLGFTLEEVEDFVAYSPRSLPTQVLKMLSTWKTIFGTNATLQELLEAMQKSRIPERCYKTAVMDLLRH